MVYAIGSTWKKSTRRKQGRRYQVWIQYQITLWPIGDMFSNMLTHRQPEDGKKLEFQGNG